MRVHYRGRSVLRAFHPWLLSEMEEPWPGLVEVQQLAGEGELRYLHRFDSWRSYRLARQALRSRNVPMFSFASPAQQYLVQEHETLFRGIRFEELRRMQIDLETEGLNPQDPRSRILLIALSDTDGFEHVLIGSEMKMIQELNSFIGERDPDVIEGHNIFDFDMAFLVARARAQNAKLAWGRDGSEVYAPGTQRRYAVRGQIRSYRPCYVHGRHIVDTLHQIQRYDIAGEMRSYGLKEVIGTLGFERKERTFVDRTRISELFDTDRERLIDYALDDVRDVRALSDLILPVEFYQTQIVPDAFQSACLVGTGTKINTLMISQYAERGQAIPTPQASRAFPGGYTALRLSGVFSRVVKADVESLYPSTMITFGIAPATDTENVFLPMLQRLTRMRLDAKARLGGVTGIDRAYWDGLQQGLKVLINSCYGYLGYTRANFNDYDAAGRVTTLGQQIARRIEKLIEAEGGRVIEVDTDGVYFTAPEGVNTQEDEEAIIRRISDQLTEGINLAHDGSYLGMLSLKAKNYVLLKPDGELVLRGSSLRSRREEPMFTDFIARAARLLIEGDRSKVRRLYSDLQSDIVHRKIAPERFCRTETVSERTLENPRLHKLAHLARGRSLGDRIKVYRRHDGTLASIEEYAGDEDVMHLLKKLHKAAGRFQPLVTREEFVSLFPPPQKATFGQISCLPLFDTET